jgi:hypothetical protein
MRATRLHYSSIERNRYPSRDGRDRRKFMLDHIRESLDPLWSLIVDTCDFVPGLGL